MKSNKMWYDSFQVKSTHEVNGYGQLKYIIHDILPAYVDKVSEWSFQIDFC